ncbi:nucleoside hydrolase-like domain-containing protein [Phocaeicola sp.]|jgi:hypothetical protein
MKLQTILAIVLSMSFLSSCTMGKESVKPRVLISTDIGGSDPDDNQSMVHLLMYSDLFNLEGLVSSPSYGGGSKEKILRMIDLYEKDFPKLQQHQPDLMVPDELRKLCKQGRKGEVSFRGIAESTEGSDWIIQCARRKSGQPLWVLVWGGLDDVAQALHDAPDIESKIRVYWIGGPNKKWSVNSYAYIVENFPNLWMIENNASYRGFIGNNKKQDKFNAQYYDECIKGAGVLGFDFKNYYDGNVKMGDTPSLLYMMHGNPDDPSGESWGGSFEKMAYSPRTVFHRNTTLQDTVPVYSLIEFHFKGPVMDKEAETPCFIFCVDKQDWDGVYMGNGEYVVRYAPKAPAVLDYTITSKIKELDGMTGSFVVSRTWPGKATFDAYPLGENWYTDKADLKLFDVDGNWQGYKTVSQWRNEVLGDWEVRWNWLK